MSRHLSLSEIDSLCRKAARGAGYGWGMSEEAGRTARWLAAYGFQGPEALAHWLRVRVGDTGQHVPALRDHLWHAQRGICPLTAGTLVNDRESQLLGGSGFEFVQVHQPMLMLSMVARIVENRDSAIVFSMGDRDITCTAQGIVCNDDFPWEKSRADVSCHLAVSETESMDESIEPSAQSRSVSDKALETLLELAHKTYAPATEASRLAGAGAGTNDND